MRRQFGGGGPNAPGGEETRSLVQGVSEMGDSNGAKTGERQGGGSRGKRKRRGLEWLEKRALFWLKVHTKKMGGGRKKKKGGFKKKKKSGVGLNWEGGIDNQGGFHRGGKRNA